MMDFLLSAEDRDFAAQLRSLLRAHVSEDLRERIGRGEQPSPAELVATQRLLNSHGLAVPHWPVDWGGRDWTPVQQHLWAQELAENNVPPPIVFNVAMVGPVIAEFGSEALKARFLPATANADIWWAQGFSEPGAGSDLASLQTRAVLDGDHYVVNGQKTWTTWAQHADWIFCLVRTDPSAKPQRGISFLLIDLRSPGVDVRPIQLIDGEHEVNEVFFDNVRVPADQLVGVENEGWTYAKFLLGNERTSNAGLGIIKSRLNRIRSLQRSLPADCLLDARVAQLEIEATALEASVLRVLAREGSLPPGTPDPMSSMLKLKGTELQQEAAELLVDLLGPGAVHEAPDNQEVEARRLAADNALPTYLNWRKASIYAGSNEIQRQIIAKTILKL